MDTCVRVVRALHREMESYSYLVNNYQLNNAVNVILSSLSRVACGGRIYTPLTVRSPLREGDDPTEYIDAGREPQAQDSMSMVKPLLSMAAYHHCQYAGTLLVKRLSFE